MANDRHAQNRMSCPFRVTPHSHCPLHLMVGPPFSSPRGGVIPALTPRLLNALVQLILRTKAAFPSLRSPEAVLSGGGGALRGEAALSSCLV